MEKARTRNGSELIRNTDFYWNLEVKRGKGEWCTLNQIIPLL